MTDANCMRMPVAHAPHDWGLKGQERRYRCDGTPVSQHCVAITLPHEPHTWGAEGYRCNGRPVVPDAAPVSGRWARQEGRRPSVGEIVHFVTLGSAPDEYGDQEYPPTCQAAIVTEVFPDDPRIFASLAVFGTEGLRFHRDPVRYEPSGERGTWHWLPARSD